MVKIIRCRNNYLFVIESVVDKRGCSFQIVFYPSEIENHRRFSIEVWSFDIEQPNRKYGLMPPGVKTKEFV